MAYTCSAHYAFRIEIVLIIKFFGFSLRKQIKISRQNLFLLLFVNLLKIKYCDLFNQVN